MPKTPLIDEHHFVRQCTGKTGKNFSDAEDGYHNLPWLLGNTYQPDVANPNLSGSWLERREEPWRDMLNRVRDELINGKRRVSKTHNFAVIKVRQLSP